jgi:hypothetical protein
MKNEGAIHPAPPPTLPPARVIAAATAIVMAAYTLTLMVANALPLLDALVGGAGNTVGTMLFGLGAYAIVARWLVGRPMLVQALGHLAVGAAYALLTYWLLIVMIGLINGASLFEFTVRPFAGGASAWQLLENATIYAAVALLAYLHARPEPVAVILSEGPGEGDERPLSRYFIRSGDDIRPIDVADIVSISGADDYAEVATMNGRHLVRMTLAEFEKALDPARFIRVHRSRIVNLERIERAEPAGGGRLLLHMQDGEAIAASRAGSRLLRDRVI